MIDARRLRVLVAIAEHRSFTRAAEALAMTQPAVSRQLAALEAEAGARLVARGPRHVALTPAGAALAEEAAAILPAIDAAARRVRGLTAADGGAVRLGAVPSALATLVPDALCGLRARRPRVEIQADEGWTADLVRRTARGDLDVAVVSSAAAARTPPGALLRREPLVALLAAGHPLARRRRLALGDLAGEPWLVAPGPGGRAAMLAACAAEGFTPRIAGSATWQAAGRLVAAGLGVALAPACIAEVLAREPGVVAREPAGRPVRELRLVTAPHATRMPAVRDLTAHLHDAAGASAGRPAEAGRPATARSGRR